MAGETAVSITVADVTTRFLVGSSSFAGQLTDRYESFLDDREPQCRYRVVVHADRPGLAGEGVGVNDNPRLLLEGENLLIQRGDFSARFDPRSGEGTLAVHDSPYSFDSFFRVFCSWLMLQRGGFLLHASAVVRKGDGYIFTGPSGSGKSTISGLSPEACLLSDELAAVMAVDGAHLVCGNPFWGNFQKGKLNGSAPVRRLFFLHKARANRIEPLPVAEKMKRILGNVLYFGRDIRLTDQLLAACVDFVKRVPAAELHFRPDESVWRCIEDAR